MKPLERRHGFVFVFVRVAVAIDGKRSLMFGMESRDVPGGMGVIRGENEWSIALAVEKLSAEIQ